MRKRSLTYQQAGVDISQGNRTVEMIKPLVEKTFRKEVLGGLGGFGALFALDMDKYKHPVLVSGTDGVGTKLAVSQLLDKHDTIGIDCVAMCVNDILVTGAEPLFFLDYLAVGKLEPEQAASLVAGIAEGCSQAGCALIGGETAEMPGFYAPGEYEIAVTSGDLLLGLSSTGLHSNGYSLARRVFFDVNGWKPNEYIEELGCTLGEELLKPTRIYVKLIQALIQECSIKGMAHITGGGLIENPPRILPPGTHLEIEYGSWQVPPVFDLIAKGGPVDTMEMMRTFNMGIGFVLIADPKEALRIQQWLKDKGETVSIIGKVVEGDPGVSIRGLV
ncbi:MAG: phosphoribosylformylglycinamidine cyclo-ligase [Firmicutes bacterium HGW-Firmicutes-12]|nr:MAG: phosphoribosylformylglycinamidine cyclo-ligase [Firmicutes bacterium HGW-Firmicutes-12]